ncbi:hypothetical protein V5P93_003259 [Actinokineospora auranticolor]|uniref:DUF4267 domain-containing protein n=1 Tax=Actinokineospora auranticolor TaxID=155976 RepID=A0A2S6H1Q5_9PSEU|nr:hypothetical protein [Actinokineospora auranticolor]PPK71393.1 hypothetical protein CLV40_101583 [Actinokineospora auranticolor]
MTGFRWTVAVCSLVFTIGTAVQNFGIVDLPLIERTMVLAGNTPDQAAADAPGFLSAFRLVGCVFIVGNALGVSALTSHRWPLWVALAVNACQAAGVFMIPFEVSDATADRYGPAGLLPSLVTDGGALLLTTVLLIALARGAFRARPAAIR